MNLSNFSQIRFNGKDISVAKLNGNVLYEEPRRGVTLTFIVEDPSTGEEIHREIIEYPKGTEVNTYDICSTISIEGYKHGTCSGGNILTVDEDKEYHTSCFEKEDTSEYGVLTRYPGSKEYVCTVCGYPNRSVAKFRDPGSPTGYKCPMCQSILEYRP